MRMAGAVEPATCAGFFNMIPMANSGDLKRRNDGAGEDGQGEGWTKSSTRLLPGWVG